MVVNRVSQSPFGFMQLRRSQGTVIITTSAAFKWSSMHTYLPYEMTAMHWRQAWNNVANPFSGPEPLRPLLSKSGKRLAIESDSSGTLRESPVAGASGWAGLRAAQFQYRWISGASIASDGHLMFALINMWRIMCDFGSVFLPPCPALLLLGCCFAW